MTAERDDHEREVMLPPPGCVEQMVARGLAEVLALEAMQRVIDESAGINDTVPPAPRKRRDSAIIVGLVSDDAPTLPFIRLDAARE